MNKPNKMEKSGKNSNSHSNSKKADSQVEKFEWQDRTQHVLFFLFYLMDYGGLGFHVFEIIRLDGQNEKAESFPIFTFLVLVIFIGYPMLFLQTFIGQYTKRSCLFFGEMLPVAYGLGYSMLLVSFFKFTVQMFYTSVLVYYLIVSICNASPPWMNCSKSFYKKFPNCFSKADIDLCPSRENSDEPCFPPGTKTLATYIFKEVIAFGRIKNEYKSEHWLLSEDWFRIVFHAFNHLIVYIILMIAAQKSMKNIYWYLRIAVSFALIALLSILVVVITRPGSSFGLTVMIKKAHPSSLFTSKVWLESFQSIVEMLRLAEGGHVLFGSFIPESKPDFWRSVHLIHVFINLTISASVYFFLFLGLLYFKLNMEWDLLESTEENVIFLTCPTFLGIQASATFFCISFFLVLVFINFHSLAIKLIVLEKSITIHLRIPEYSFYIRSVLGTLAFILTFFIAIPELTHEFLEIRNLFQLFEQISPSLQIVIVLMYGLQRLYDDIEFVTKTKVNKFIKFSWIVTPILSSLTFYTNYTTSINHTDLLKLIFVIIMTTPFIICLFYKIFSFGKQKNLIGIFKPTDDFGPPSIEKRIFRILHNPRLEVRYKRIEEVCQHNCLLDSNAIEVAIGEEIDLITRLSQEISLSAQEKGLEEKIISQIAKHQEYLRRAMAKDKKKKNLKL